MTSSRAREALKRGSFTEKLWLRYTIPHYYVCAIPYKHRSLSVLLISESAKAGEFNLIMDIKGEL
jgi:hypothetical protein